MDKHYEHAQRLMDEDNRIWRELGFKHGGDVEKNKEKYHQALKKVKFGRVSQKVLDHLENENYHSMHGYLHERNFARKQAKAAKSHAIQNHLRKSNE